VGVLLLGLVLALAAVVPAQAATPAQIVLLDTDPTYDEVIVTKPDGTTVAATPGQFQLQVTPAGGAATVHQGFCVDTDHPIGEGTVYDISLQTADDDPFLASPAANAAAWLIQEADALIAAAADPALEAGALQVAVWVSLGEAAAGAPTDDAALNVRAAALVALAQGKGPAGPVSVSAAASSTCAGGPGTTLTLTGAPGATASLAVTSGQGSLSASAVTFSAAGTASVTLSSAAVGPVQVTVTSAGSQLTRATRLPGAGTEPQETGFLTPRTHTASVTVAFTSCGAPGPGGRPTRPPGAAQTPTLGVVKSGPATTTAGAVVPYTIVVRNTSTTIARGVVVTDTLPAGMAYLRASRKPASLGKRIVWRLGALAPGARRTITVYLQAPSGISGVRTNLVQVSAQRAPIVRDSATTRFRRARAVLQPPVTG
jgi:uncharacterized repeat protein (TIGR01451 family)